MKMICCKCAREMRCKKTGQLFRWGKGHCYSGDVYACSACGSEACAILGNSFLNDTSPAIQMDKAEVTNG